MEFLSYIKRYPLLHLRLTGLFLFAFILFFLIHDYFMISIQTELNFLYKTIAESSGITNIRPSIITLVLSTFFYGLSLFIIYLGTQTSIWFEARNKFSLTDKTTYIILGISAILGLLFALILPGLPLFTTFVSLTALLFIISYAKAISLNHMKLFLSFLKQYVKIACISTVFYLGIISFHLLISLALLQQLGQNPYDVIGGALFIVKWSLHLIVFHYIIHGSAYAAKQIGKSKCKVVSIKTSFKEAFLKKQSYIHSGLFLVYVAFVFSIGTGLLNLPNGNFFNFIFMTIFFLGGFIAFFVYEANTK